VRRAALALLMAAMLASSGAASAQLHLDVEAGTDFPISVGGGLRLEVPYGIRIGTTVGVMPSGYVQAINAAVVSAGGYTESTADLVETTLQSSLAWRTHVGWIASFGLYVDVGYGLITLGGGSSGEAIVASATGTAIPEGSSGDRQYDVSSTLHMFDVEIGWQGVFWDSMVVRAALGFAGTLAATSSVDQQFATSTTAGQRAVDRFEDWAEGYLVDTYTSYVFTPVITVAVGYRFF
jgi:hypothetical protein